MKLDEDWAAEPFRNLYIAEVENCEEEDANLATLLGGKFVMRAVRFFLVGWAKVEINWKALIADIRSLVEISRQQAC